MRIAVLPDSSQDDDAMRLSFDRDVVRIGRRRACEVRLPDRAVSLDHARILRTAGRYALVDADSTNGTFVAGRRLRAGQPHALQDGDVIQVGPFRLLFEVDTSGSETTSEQTASLARRLLRDAGSGGGCPYLAVISGSHAGARLRLELRDGAAPYTIGRSPQCDLVLIDPDASREHVQLVRDFAGVRLTDLASKNGVQVNGRVPGENQPLLHGDRIRIGETQLRYCDPADERLEELEHSPDPEPADVPVWRGERAALVLAAGALALCAAFWLWWLG